ncbi:hypothetical protein [Polaromonas sp. CG9_12]|nr:hypothetical protein [Polaromonas sp. CG9_12]
MATDPNFTNWQGAVDDSLAYGRNAYLEAIPDLASANATAQGVSGLQTRLAGNLGLLSQNLTDRTGKFSGMQDTYAQGAFGFNSEARQEKAASEAMAGVTSRFADMRSQGLRSLGRMGVNPNSARSQALGQQVDIASASAQAGAATKARNDLEAVANERQKTAIGFGANLPTQAAQAASTGALVGNAAVSTAAAPVNNRLSFAGGIGKIYGSAADDYKGLYSVKNLSATERSRLAQQDAADARADDAAFWTSLGNVTSSALNSKAGQSAVDKGLSWLFS